MKILENKLPNTVYANPRPDNLGSTVFTGYMDGMF